MTSATDRLKAGAWVAVLGTLLAWVACSFLPAKWRLWGLTFLAPLSPLERGVVIVATLTLCLLVWVVFSERWERPGQDAAGPALRPFWFALGGALLCMALLDRTHFLGGGGSRLDWVSSMRIRGGMEFRLMQPIVKALAAAWGEPTGALRAFQLVTVGSGAVCAWLAASYAVKIFGQGFRALAFALGLLTAGYMLVFFGFVGDHALLVLGTLAFTCAGAAYLKRNSSLLGAIAAVVLAVLAHPLGWSLLPPLLYLVAAGRTANSARKGSSGWLAFLLPAAATAVLLVLLVRHYTASAGFRLMLVPLFRDRLTVGGYTLFSVNHLLDVVSLLALLVPAFIVAAVFLRSVRREPGDRTSTFLLCTALFATLAVFCLDPALGMPRGWDLFALAGVPWAAWLYYRMLSVQSPRAVTAVLVCAALSGSALLCRAWVQMRPDPAVRQAMNYFALDPQRSRTGVLAVGKYLLDHNTTVVYSRLEDFRREHYPEEAMRQELNPLFRDNKQLQAAALCQEIIRRDPRIPSPWMFLGFILNNAGRFDSALAYLAIADGLDPHNPSILNELGRAHYFQGDRGRARDLWLESLDEDSLQYVPQLALANYHKDRGEAAEASRRLELAASRPGAPADAYLQLARDHAERNRLSEARVALVEAMTRGADTAKVSLLVKEYPDLGPVGPPVVPDSGSTQSPK